MFINFIWLKKFVVRLTLPFNVLQIFFANGLNLNELFKFSSLKKKIAALALTHFFGGKGPFCGMKSNLCPSREYRVLLHLY